MRERRVAWFVNSLRGTIDWILGRFRTRECARRSIGAWPRREPAPPIRPQRTRAIHTPAPPDAVQMPMRLPAGMRSPQARKRTREVDVLIDCSALRSPHSDGTWHDQLRPNRQVPRCAKRPARDPASDRPILPTMIGLPARSALSATRLNFPGRFTSSRDQEKNVSHTFVEHVIDEVDRFERGFVACADDMLEGEVARASAIENAATLTRHSAKSPTPWPHRAPGQV